MAAPLHSMKWKCNVDVNLQVLLLNLYNHLTLIYTEHSTAALYEVLGPKLKEESDLQKLSASSCQVNLPKSQVLSTSLAMSLCPAEVASGWHSVNDLLGIIRDTAFNLPLFHRESQTLIPYCKIFENCACNIKHTTKILQLHQLIIQDL